MSVIYYNVSGGAMEILQFVLSLLNNKDSLEALKPILSLFNGNSFDLKNILSNLSIEKIAPIISLFMENFNKSKSPTESVGQGVGLKPICSIADKDIIESLNSHFSNA